MSEELLEALIKQKVENTVAEIMLAAKMSVAVNHADPSARDDAAAEAKKAESIKNVIVGTEKCKLIMNKTSGIAEAVDPALPSVDESDVIDVIPIVFYDQEAVTFEKFIVDFDLGRIIDSDKYLTFRAVLGIYEKYSGKNASFVSLTDAFNGRDYAHDISLHQCNGKLVYSADAITGIKNNIIDGNYVTRKAPKAVKKTRGARKNAKSITIQNYMLDYADTGTIIESDWSLKNLAEDFKKLTGKKISPQSIRTHFRDCGIRSTDISGGQRRRIRGKVLADMIDALRSINEKPAEKKAVTKVPVKAKVLVQPSAEPKQDGLTVSLGELFDLSKFVA